MAKAFTSSAAHPSDQRARGTGSNKRNDNSTADGFAMLTVAVNHLPSRLNITGTPTIEPLGRGSLIREIEPDLSLGDERFSLNHAEILLDFFLDALSGMGAGMDEIDFAMWKARAQDRAGRVVLGPNNASLDDMAGDDDPLAGVRETIRERLRRLGIENDWSGLSGSTLFGTGAAAQTKARNVDLPRYVYASGHSLADTAEEVVIDMARQVPGMVLAQTDDGKWYADYPDSTRTPAEQSVGTITDADLYGSAKQRYFKITPPNADSLTTKIKATFADIDNDFNPSTVVYPKPGSAGETQLRNTFNGEYPRTVHFQGGMDKNHVETICRTMILTSFRPVWEWVLHSDDAEHLAGDVVRCTSRLHGRDRYVRIMRRERLTSQHVAYVGIEFDNDDHDFIMEAEETFELQAETAATASTLATFAATQPASARIQLDWTFPDGVSELTAFTDIETTTDDGTTWEHVHLGAVLHALRAPWRHGCPTQPEVHPRPPRLGNAQIQGQDAPCERHRRRMAGIAGHHRAAAASRHGRPALGNHLEALPGGHQPEHDQRPANRAGHVHAQHERADVRAGVPGERLGAGGGHWKRRAVVQNGARGGRNVAHRRQRLDGCGAGRDSRSSPSHRRTLPLH